ncbi:putative reverse transcriptase domain-containing protein [Helianthus annuus]|nr:putative reverse transcriptase domain-containing protein [Helianthus annuus]
MVVINLEKAYDSVPHRLIWNSLESIGFREVYRHNRDAYVKIETSVQVPIGDTNFFPVEVGLHQGSTLSPFLFVVVLDEFSKLIQQTTLWCLLFLDDILLLVKSTQSLNERLEE